MKISTMETIAGRVVEDTLGVIRGSALWARRVMKNSSGGIRHFEVIGLRELDLGMSETRQKAETAMMAQAKIMGADSIIGMRLEVIEMSNGVFCVNATGTAVRTLKLPMATPAFQVVSNTGFYMDMAYAPNAMAFEGSTLRH